MKSRIWFLYSLSCTCMLMYLCWNMGAMTSQPRFRIFCQQYMKESGGDLLYGRYSYNITEPYLRPSIPEYLRKPSEKPLPAKQQVSMAVFPPTIVDGKDINPDIEKFFPIRNNERKDIFINLHQYKFTINSQICSKTKLFLITVIHSAPTNSKKRDIIRTTYGSVNEYRSYRLGVVFMLGAVMGKAPQASILNESQVYHDIVQGNFPDNYKSLNRKHIMAMHWFRHHCNAEFILKLDDDAFVNPFRIVDYILKRKPLGMTMHCKLISGEGPVRASDSKWYTPMSQYPFSLLPPFCLGFAYLTTPEAWSALYLASTTNRLMDMDDLYVSVSLAMKANVKRVGFDEVTYACPYYVSLVSEENLNEMAVLLDRKNRCGHHAFQLWEKIRNLNENS